MSDEKTATAVNEAARRYSDEADMRMLRVGHALENFKRRWQPTDLRDREDFERDLTMLVVRLHQESAAAAGATFGRHAGLLLAPLLNVPPIFIPEKR